MYFFREKFFFNEGKRFFENCQSYKKQKAKHISPEWAERFGKWLAQIMPSMQM